MEKGSAAYFWSNSSFQQPVGFPGIQEMSLHWNSNWATCDLCSTFLERELSDYGQVRVKLLHSNFRCPAWLSSFTKIKTSTDLYPSKDFVWSLNSLSELTLEPYQANRFRIRPRVYQERNGRAFPLLREIESLEYLSRWFRFWFYPVSVNDVDSWWRILESSSRLYHWLLLKIPKNFPALETGCRTLQTEILTSY